MITAERIDLVVSEKERQWLRRLTALCMLACFVSALFGVELLFDGLTLMFLALLLTQVAFERFYVSIKGHEPHELLAETL